MEALHAKLCEVIAEAIQDSTDADGNIVKPSASMINVARQFLKDNGIDSVATTGSPLDKVRENLPDFSDDESNVTPFHSR